MNNTIKLYPPSLVRWHNHLDPAVVKGGWTREEDDLIMRLQHEVSHSVHENTKWCHQGSITYLSHGCLICSYFRWETSGPPLPSIFLVARTTQ